jgi:hypothetical protein
MFLLEQNIRQLLLENNMTMKLVYGEEQITSGPRDSTENQLFGSGWVVTRSNGHCLAEYESGGHGGGTISFEITEEDFEILKADLSLGDSIYVKYSLIKGDGWWADRSVGNCYVRVTDTKKYKKTGDFFINESEFTSLRNDKALFIELYQKYMK